MNTETLRHKAGAERLAALLATLRTWPWFETLRTLRQRFREDRLGVTASSLTFTTLIALVPLVTVGLAVFSAFPMFASFQIALQKYFLQALVPDAIARPVLAALTQFAAKASHLGGAGLLLLVVTALALVLTIDRTLNSIWRVRTPRPLARRILVYWAAMTLGPLAMGISLSITSYALSASRGLVGGMPGGLRLLLDVVEFTLFATVMAAMYHYVPNTPVRWRHAWAGGVFVAVGIELAKRALAGYLSLVPSYSMVYGAFATLPILLLWIYLGWVIVLLGAVIAAYAPSLRMGLAQRLRADPGWRFELALGVLRELQSVRGTVQRGLALDDLSERLQVDPLQIEPVLEMLASIDWVAPLDEPAVRHVMLCDPASTPLAPLLPRTLATGALSGRALGLAGLATMPLATALERS